MVDEKVEAPPDNAPKFKHFKLAPDSALQAATGGVIGHVTMFGREVPVRCATIEDCAWIEQLVGKNPLLGEFNAVRDGKIDLLVAIFERATGIAKSDAMKFGAAAYVPMIEVSSAFLWGGALSRGAPPPS